MENIKSQLNELLEKLGDSAHEHTVSGLSAEVERFKKRVEDLLSCDEVIAPVQSANTYTQYGAEDGNVQIGDAAGAGAAGGGISDQPYDLYSYDDAMADSTGNYNVYCDMVLDDAEARVMDDEANNVIVNDAVENDTDYGDRSDWNKLFQEALDLCEDTKEEEYVKYKLLTKLTIDFARISQDYGRLIISELCLPEKNRTIAATNIGGIAGGDKYILNNIMFKLARDVTKPGWNGRYLYGGNKRCDEFASKAAGHDQKAAALYFSAQQSMSEDGKNAGVRIAVPCIAVIDYRGFRLVAMPVIPIRAHAEPVYGSRDAGATVHVDDSEFNDAMHALGKQLHLKSHLVKGVTVDTAVDVEGHIGSDGRRYLIDLARALPPESPVATAHLPRFRTSVFFRLLRPELLSYLQRKTPVPPLSSDAFSMFGVDHAGEHNQEVTLATEVLVKDVIPAFAHWLVKECATRSVEELHKLRHTELTVEMHNRGVNCRHLGLCRQEVLKQSSAVAGVVQASNMLLVEMVKRALKNILRSWLRDGINHDRPSEYMLNSVVVRFLNLCSGSSKLSQVFWTDTVIEALTVRFGKCALADEPAGVLKVATTPTASSLLSLPTLSSKQQSSSKKKSRDRSRGRKNDRHQRSRSGHNNQEEEEADVSGIAMNTKRARSVRKKQQKKRNREERRMLAALTETAPRSRSVPPGSSPLLTAANTSLELPSLSLARATSGAKNNGVDAPQPDSGKSGATSGVLDGNKLKACVMSSMFHIITYILQMIGKRLTVKCVSDCENDAMDSFEFTMTDIVEGSVRVKFMPFLGLVRGKFLAAQGYAAAARDDLRVSARLLSQAVADLRATLRGDPTSDIAKRSLTLCESTHYCVCALLANIASRAPDTDGKTVLMAAAEVDDMKVVTNLISWKADMNARTSELNATAMILAARKGSVDSMRALLLAKADPDLAYAKSDMTPLHLGVLNDDSGVVELLLQHRANANVKQRSTHMTPLMIAAERRHIGTVRALLRAVPPPQVNMVNRDGLTALQIARESGHNEVSSMIAAVREPQLDLHRAAVTGRVNVLEGLVVEKKVSIDCVDENGRTALVLAISKGHFGAAEFLLSKGANPNACLGQKHALILAMDKHRMSVSIVKPLLRAQADVEARDESGRTALTLAAYEGSLALTDLLLEFEAKVDALNNNEETPLHKASARGHYKIVQRLIQAGANVNAKNFYEWTALSRATWHGHEEVVAVLLGAKADVSAQNKKGRTALHYACQRNYPSVARMLLKAKADPNTLDYRQKSSVVFAEKHNISLSLCADDDRNTIETALVSKFI